MFKITVHIFVILLHAALTNSAAALAGNPVASANEPAASAIVGDALDKFVRPPLIAAPAISSDGHYLSGLLRLDNDNSAVTIWHVDSGFGNGFGDGFGDDLGSGKTLPYLLSDINWMSWVGGGRLLLSLKESGLVLYDAHLAKLRPLIDKGGPRPGQLAPFLLSPLHSDPTSILMQWEDDIEEGYPAVYKVNAVTGASQKIISAWRPIVRWWASPEGEVKLGEGFTGRKQKLYARKSDGGWRLISKRDFFRGPTYSVLAVETGGATALVLSAHESDTRELWRMHTASGDMIAKLASHAEFDITAALIDPVTDLTIGAGYVAENRQEVIWKASEKAEQRRIEALLGGITVNVASASRDGRRVLYRHRDSNRPARYFLYDRETNTVTTLPNAPEFNALPKKRIETVDIEVKGADRPMQAIFSHPESGSSGKAVLLVHGGPVRRVSTEYNSTVSWLISNGYSVLQPNFRGSSGYGERWRRAGYGEWGRTMQRDLRAAAQWLIREGGVPKGHMCVMGGSYGGYAAMMSAIMDDDLFACAVSLNGVTSLPHLVAYLNTKRFSQLTVPRIRGRLSDRTLRRRSPLNRVDLVRVPLLMLHATKDQNVPFEHGVLMAKALRKHDIPHEFIVLKGASHVLRRSEDRRTYLEKAIEFIDSHIGGKGN